LANPMIVGPTRLSMSGRCIGLMAHTGTMIPIQIGL
jgi:hypothetical protein